MAIDSINFSISVGKESDNKKENILQKLNREKIFQNQGKINLEINNKQKKHVMTAHG